MRWLVGRFCRVNGVRVLDLFFGAGLGSLYAVFLSSYQPTSLLEWTFGLVLHVCLWVLAVLLALANWRARTARKLHVCAGVLCVALFFASMWILPDNEGGVGVSGSVAVLFLALFVMMRSIAVFVYESLQA
jgi:hypothetical protein